MINRINGVKGLKNTRKSDFNNIESRRYVTSPLLCPKDTVSFTAKSKAEKNRWGLDINLSEPAEMLLENSEVIAKQLGHSEINPLHIMFAGLGYIETYINMINSGAESPDNLDELSYPIVLTLNDEMTADVYKSPQNRLKMQEIIKNSKAEILNELLKIPATKVEDSSKKAPQKLRLNAELASLITEFSEKYAQIIDCENISDGIVFYSTMSSTQEPSKTIANKLSGAVADAIWLENASDFDKFNTSIYDKQSQKTLKNLDVGTNMVLLKDKSTDSNLILGGLFNTLKNSPDLLNTESGEVNFIVVGEDASLGYLMNKVNSLKNSKADNVLVVKNLSENIKRYLEMQNIETTQEHVCLAQKNVSNFLALPETTKLIFMLDNDYYNTAKDNSAMKNLFQNTGVIKYNPISLKEAKTIFKELPDLTSEIKKDFTASAVQKAVEESEKLSGDFPEKAQRLMQVISSNYIDKKGAITVTDVEKFIGSADMPEDSNAQSYLKYIPDTNKRIKDIYGKSATVSEAKYLANQLKTGELGVQGLLVYEANGNIGGGRRHTVKAIAGEARAPYFETNASDFVQYTNDGILIQSSQIMKDMFDRIKAKANENPKKSAVLFIEDFDRLCLKQLANSVENKAMLQIEREMKKAKDKGYNILVAGSVPSEIYSDNQLMRYELFNDSLVIESPAESKEEQKAVIEKILKKNNIKLEGTKEQADNILDFASKLSLKFSFLELKDFVKKSRAVAIERGHKSLSKADITEGYLRLFVGRANANVRAQDYEKEIVASHECGHATNLHVMNLLAKRLEKPWNVPQKVGFVTLDPRGDFGGAVYPFEDTNSEHSFEKLFASIVCSYGGHSCEKRFFEQDGSLGITSDLKNATHLAEVMVKYFGQGSHTGKVSLYSNPDVARYYSDEIGKDIRNILDGALMVSDRITEVYDGFNKEFTQKYSKLVGTGDCIIDGDIFRKEFAQWKLRQSEEEQKKFDTLDNEILAIINVIKNDRK